MAAALTASVVSAQKGEFHLSIQAAPQLSWLSSTNAAITASGSQFGIGLGIHGDYYFSERYALTAGLVFSTNAGGTLQYNKSAAMNILSNTTLANGVANTSFNTGTKVTYQNQYVELPIGLKLHTEEVNGMRFFGNLPVVTFAFRTRAQGDISGKASYVDNTTIKIDEQVDFKNENIGNDVSIFNLYVGGGAGIEYRLGETTTAIAGIFYQHGLINATRQYKYQKDPQTELTDDASAQLSGLSLRVGVMF